MSGKDIAETWSASFSKVGPTGNYFVGVACVVFESLLGLRHVEFNETFFALFSEFRKTCNNNVIEFSFRSQV